MATPSSPTARGRELGRRLKELRESRGKTLADIAEELSCSQAKVSRMETGQRPVQALDIKVLCRYYALSAHEQEQLTTLAAESRKRGWWQDIDYLDDPGRTYLGLEAACSEIWTLEVLRTPGLLQPATYTRAWVSQIRPPGFWSEDSVAEIVASRARRQERILNGSLRLRALVDERAFLRGSAEFIAPLMSQIEALTEHATRDNVQVRIVPLIASPHPGLDGAFNLMKITSDEATDVVFVEGQYGNVIYEKKDLVDQYRQVYRTVEERALSDIESQAWLRHRYSELAEYSKGVD